MNILLINGSPKGKNSNSLRLATRFIEGVSKEKEKNGETVALEELHVSTMRIGSCKGCFSCWKNTPGTCCIADDMEGVIQKQLWADLIIWSFPLYYFNVPGILKNLIDRQLPMNLPFMSEADNGYGSGSHDSRYDSGETGHVLISTCGFYSAEGNYDSVCRMFDHFLGKGNYESIFCGQGELFRVKELSARTDQYLSLVERAGAEYASGGISEETGRELQSLLYPKEVFEKMADASWGVSKEDNKKEEFDSVFTKQMAALYNKDSYDGRDRVLEMHYTDLDRSYQILLGKEGSRLYEDGSLVATTKINTPFDVWQSIARGELDGAEALGRQLYTVEGDFSLMLDWDKFFGDPSEKAKKGSAPTDAGNQKKPSMLTMLIPWISLWVAVSIDARIGSAITLAIVAAVPLLMKNHRFTIWDRISIAAVGILAAATSVTRNWKLFTNIGYLAFGLLWLCSCLTKEPLCAAYVKYNYGGDKARSNPLFMKTNYVLAACWGVLYVLTAVWTWIGRRNGLGISLLVINNLMPVVMGIFTAWFEKWYPAKLARGK